MLFVSWLQKHIFKCVVYVCVNHRPCVTGALGLQHDGKSSLTWTTTTKCFNPSSSCLWIYINSSFDAHIRHKKFIFIFFLHHLLSKYKKAKLFGGLSRLCLWNCCWLGSATTTTPVAAGDTFEVCARKETWNKLQVRHSRVWGLFFHTVFTPSSAGGRLTPIWSSFVFGPHEVFAYSIISIIGL